MSEFDCSDRQYDVVLIQMPYTWLSPSLALGLLKSDLKNRNISVAVDYASHRLIRYMGAENYRKCENALSSLNDGWEVLFAPFAGFKPGLSTEELFDIVDQEIPAMSRIRDLDFHDTGTLRTVWPALTEAADDFLDLETELILRHRPKIVGCSLMIQQRNASLALLRRLKQRDPQVITVLGGGVCAGETGMQFLKHAPFLDYVFSGDGDLVFAEGCELLLKGEQDRLHRDYPFFLHRGGNTAIRAMEDINRCSIPDYEEYYTSLVTLPRTGLANHPQNALLVESSRGCWWGEKHRCRFCGMHYCPESVHYREKEPERFWREVTELSRRYDQKVFMLADCILSPDFIAALPDVCPEERRGIILYAECKSNLTSDEIRRLRENGFTRLQPGIEALQDDLLRLMNKGCTTIQQIRLLRDMRYWGVNASWNILHSFPGEKTEWYEEMIALIPLLYHLEPAYTLTHVILARGNEFHLHPEAFGVGRILLRPCDLASGPDDAEFLWKTSNYFATPDLYLPDEVMQRLRKVHKEWKEAFYHGAHLLYEKRGEATLVRDARDLKNIRNYRLTGAREAVFEGLLEPVAICTLQEKLSDTYTVSELEEALDRLCEAGLVYRKNGIAIALPVRSDMRKYFK